MKSDGKVYEKKSFTKEEWNDQVMRSTLPMLSSDMYSSSLGVSPAPASKDSLSPQNSAEPSIPKLLLNYFVCMAYEEASIRMARELGYIKSNKDAQEFNSLYKICERAHITELIKKGKVSQAMEEINTNFGIEVLECDSDSGSRMNGRSLCESNTRHSSSAASGKEDLHFKLLLLNLIEMIRSHDEDMSTAGNTGDTEESDEFVLRLISYAQEKLALKASSNRAYMAELELVMTLLLFPMYSQTKIKKPKSLKKLYSLSLRTKIADLVNRKLLSHVHADVANICCQDSKFPDLIGSGNCITDRQSSAFSEMLLVRPKEDIGLNLKTDKLADMKDAPESLLRPSNSPVSEDWAKTSDMIKAQQSNTQTEPMSDPKNSSAEFDLSEYQYEAKLVQVMKLWAWCENQLHNNDIGVPRVGSDI